MGRMRTLGLALVVAATGIAAAPGAEEWTVTPGGWVSGEVEYVRTIAEETGGAVDAVLHEDLLYVTSWRSFSIYDVRDPEAPERLVTEPLVASLYNEQPQTNGEILLISRDAQYAPPSEHARGGGALDIYDVTDPTSPELLATYHVRMTDPVVGPFHRSERDHLWTCVLDCSYAYSAGGTILDLSDPAEPTHAGRWTDVADFRDGPSRMHHVGEIAPGIVLTGGLPMYVLDLREDPTAPKILASFEPETTLAPPLVEEPVTIPSYKNPETLPARSAWPGGLQGRLAIVSMETPLEGQCNPRAGDVQTFLATGWQGQGGQPSFAPADRYVLDTNGTYTDGAPPYNVWGCSAYGLDVHPDFGQAGGSAAVTFFEHGVRVLDVDEEGRISERGGFVPIGGNSTAPRWLSDDLLFVTDIHRGIDILRVG